MLEASKKINIHSFRTSRINLVFLGGKALVGKTTSAKYLTDVFSSYNDLRVKHTALAAPIKKIAEAAFGWDGKKDPAGRRLLQVLGTDAGRAYNENLWVEYLNKAAYNLDDPFHFMFVDDWRFPNEADYFKNNFLFDVTTIRIERPGTENALGDEATHASEVSLPSAEKEQLMYNKDSVYNFVIFNDSTIETLYYKLAGVMTYLASKIIRY